MTLPTLQMNTDIKKYSFLHITWNKEIAWTKHFTLKKKNKPDNLRIIERKGKTNQTDKQIYTPHELCFFFTSNLNQRENFCLYFAMCFTDSYFLTCWFLFLSRNKKTNKQKNKTLIDFPWKVEEWVLTNKKNSFCCKSNNRVCSTLIINNINNNKCCKLMSMKSIWYFIRYFFCYIF